ncbi:Disease resistance protein RPM1 [Hordeum vulgare]|nr:Disease resistance protein RPM1 [Hordeum vulgare]
MLAKSLEAKIELAEKKAREKQERWKLLKDVDERRAHAAGNKAMANLLTKENWIMTLNRNDMDNITKEWNNFGNNNAYRDNFILRPFPSNPSNNFGNSYNNAHGNYNKLRSDLESNIKEFINSQYICNASMEGKLLKIDDLARTIDRMSLDIDALKLRCAPPKINMDETLKAMRVSMNESKERTTQIRARHEWLKKACSRDENHEDLKVLGVTPIESLFSNIKPNDDGAGYESTLVEKRPNDLESIYLDAKSTESGVEDIQTLSSNEITTLDFKEFNYDSCSLI